MPCNGRLSSVVLRPETASLVQALSHRCDRALDGGASACHFGRASAATGADAGEICSRL